MTKRLRALQLQAEGKYELGDYSEAASHSAAIDRECKALKAGARGAALIGSAVVAWAIVSAARNLGQLSWLVLFAAVLSVCAAAPLIRCLGTSQGTRSELAFLGWISSAAVALATLVVRLS